MRYKLIIRTDDVGYTPVHDMGVWKTYEEGYATSADVMLECPGSVEALKKLRTMPWVTVGWHAHFWGSPVLDPGEVKSLLIPGTNRFKPDIRNREEIEYDEILKEMRAQLNRCVEILGKAPDVGVPNIFQKDSEADTPFLAAMKRTMDEYGIAYHFASRFNKDQDGNFSFGAVNEKWKDKNIFIKGNGVGDEGLPETFVELEKTDPVRWLLEDSMNIKQFPDGAAIMHGFHPGYVDYYVARLGDNGPNARYVTLSRTYDVEALCSKRLHDWILENDIELCSTTDALYGTHHYQNHLRNIGSDLCVL